MYKKDTEPLHIPILDFKCKFKVNTPKEDDEISIHADEANPRRELHKTHWGSVS